MAQVAVPDPNGVPIIQTSDSKSLSVHFHPVKIYAHRPADTETDIIHELKYLLIKLHRCEIRHILCFQLSSPHVWLLPIGCVVDFDAFGVGQAVLGLYYVIIINILPTLSVIQLPLVKLTISELWI